jgi:hypothetical protein
MLIADQRTQPSLGIAPPAATDAVMIAINALKGQIDRRACIGTPAFPCQLLIHRSPTRSPCGSPLSMICELTISSKVDRSLQGRARL